MSDGARNAKCKMQNAKSRTENGVTSARQSRIFYIGQHFFRFIFAKGYHKIGFCASKRLHSFCILHFAFCILKQPDKPKFELHLNRNSTLYYSAKGNFCQERRRDYFSTVLRGAGQAVVYGALPRPTATG